jgi:YgiT-type zinc finger domain-containing protein
MRGSIQQSRVFCPSCQVGTYHLKLVTYYAWHGENLITAPDFPSWICDVCGRIEYDEKAVNELRSLLAYSTDARIIRKANIKLNSIKSKYKNQRSHKTNENQ